MKILSETPSPHDGGKQIEAECYGSARAKKLENGGISVLEGSEPSAVTIVKELGTRVSRISCPDLKDDRRCHKPMKVPEGHSLKRKSCIAVRQERGDGRFIVVD